MTNRVPLALSTTALVVALVGSTPLGQAAESALDQVVPRAKRADFAANAGKLNGHKSSVNPSRGQIPVVGTNGKLSASIGAVGPAGPAGPQGPPGRHGIPARHRAGHRAQRRRGLQAQRLVPGRKVRALGRLGFRRGSRRRPHAVRLAPRLELGVAVPDQQRHGRREAEQDALRRVCQRGLVGGPADGLWRLTTATSRSSPSSSGAGRSSRSSVRARTCAIGRTTAEW